MGQDDVKIPQFKGHSNWIEFKQKLILKISLIKSVTGFTLDYIELKGSTNQLGLERVKLNSMTLLIWRV